MQEIQQFRELCDSHFMFKIMVNSSDKVKQMLGQHGMTPAEFFRPFGSFKDKSKNIKIKIVTKEKIWENLRINFVDSDEFKQGKKQQVEDYTKEVLKQNLPNIKTINYNHQTQNMPWFAKACDVLFDACHYQFDINFLDQPLCIFNCISIDEDNIETTLKDLHLNQIQLNNEIFKYNPNDLSSLIKVNILFYDSQVHNDEYAHKVNDKLRSVFPNYSNKQIRLNSGTSIQMQWDNYLGRNYYQNVKRQLGVTLLSENDFNSTNLLISEIILRFVQSWLEGQLVSLYSQYKEAVKSSISSTFKKLWKKSDKVSNQMYQLMPKEALYCRLADYYFILKEYDQSAIIYKLMIEEVKGKSQVHQAFYQEMWCISVMLGEQDNLQKNDIPLVYSHLQEAGENYSKTPGYSIHMIRTVVYLLVSLFRYQKFETNLMEHIWEYTYKVKQDNKSEDSFPLFHVLLLEQHSFLFLKRNIPQFRKYCLHLLFSGYKYGSLGLQTHALRCFLLIEKTYIDVKWPMLSDFIYKYITKYYCELGKFEESMKYVKKTINNARKADTAERHLLLLTDTLKIFSSMDTFNFSEQEMNYYLSQGSDIRVPEVKQYSIDIETSEEQIFELASEKKFLKKTRKSILEPNFRKLVKLNETSNLHWIQQGNILLKNSGGERSLKEKNQDRIWFMINSAQCIEEKNKIFKITNQNPEDQFRISFQNERIVVRLDLENFLKQSFEVSDMQLIYDFYDDQLNLIEDKSCVEIILTKFNCEPSAFISISLKIIPKKTGFLTIRGIKWVVLNIPTKYEFISSNNYFNKFKILPETGLLDLKFLNFDGLLYHSEIRKLNLQLSNEGQQPIDRVTIRFLEKYYFGREEIVINKQINPGCAIEENFYIKAEQPKNFDTRILIQYKIGNTYRYTRYILSIAIRQSFNITHQTQTFMEHSLISLQLDDFISTQEEEQIKQLDLLDITESHTSSKQLQINQIILLEKNWHFQSQAQIFNSAQKQLICLNLKEFDSDRMNIDQLTEISIAPKGEYKQFEENMDKIQKFKPVQSKNMKFLNLQNQSNIEVNDCLKDFPYIQIEQLSSFINEDHRFLMNEYWASEIDFYHPWLCSLVVLWSLNTGDQTLFGMWGLPKIILNSSLFTQILYKQTCFENFPLKINVACLSEYNHDFNHFPILTIPVVVIIKNANNINPISFRFESLNSDNFIRNEVDESMPLFIWEGETEKILVNLQFQEVIHVNLKVNIFGPGLYDIGRFKITFYRNKISMKIVTPVPFIELQQNNSLEAKSYIPFDKEHYFINVFQKN